MHPNSSKAALWECRLCQNISVPFYWSWKQTRQPRKLPGYSVSPMLHRSLPQVKCDQYWPTRGTETYGLIQVTLLDTVELATYCVRTFALFKVRNIQTLSSSTSYSDPPATAMKALVTNLPSPPRFRTAPARRERWGSSSSRPGQTMGFLSTPLHSWPSWDGWKLAILRMQGPWWYTAGKKQHGVTKTSWSMKLILFSPFAVMNIWIHLTKCNTFMPFERPICESFLQRWRFFLFF